MMNALTILRKVIVTHFYKVNTGFFLFVFFVLFGIPQNIAQFHLSLIDGMLKNPSFLVLVMAAWLLYNFKCMDYVIKQLKQPQQLFLYCLYNLSYIRCYAYFLFAQLLVYMPVFIYTMFVTAIAFKTNHIVAGTEILLFNTAVIGTTPLLYLRVLQKRPLLQNASLLRALPRLPKPLFSLPLFHLWRQRKQMLFISKTLSLLLLYIFIKLYQPDHYDIRPTLLCIMLAAATNSAIVFEMKIFDDFFLQMQRNFPLYMAYRFFTALLSFTVLLLPELLFVWKGYPDYFTPTDYLQIASLGVGLLSLLYSLLFTGDMTMDGYIRIVFAILATLFFILLYNPGFLLEVFMLSLSFGLYASYYYAFEKKYD